MDKILSLQDWLCYIENLHTKSVDLGLDRVQDIAIKLDLLDLAPVVIIVGGTNGKGTTCCLLENILLRHGMSVGVYSSPHLLSYVERVRINGQFLLESLHIQALAIIEGVRSVSLTYFEFTTLSSLYLLKHAKLDVVILEVGVGGRLDATNIINADVSVVTNIGIDHTDLLGTDYMSIAKEKFGIFRSGKPAIVGDFSYHNILRNIIFDWYGAVPFIKYDDWLFNIEINKQTWRWWNQYYVLDLLPFPHIPIENAAVALATISCLPFSISRKSIDYALTTAVLPGRFQIVSERPVVILDVAHNPHGANYLFGRLKMMNVLGRFRLIVGMLSSKNIFDTLRVFDELMPVWYLVSLNCSLGVSSSHLVSCMKDTTSVFREFVNVCDAFNQALLDAYVEDCIVVFGSFHTVAPVLQLIH
ncbi:bifunctional tetrahydrofolate synthase/dihydrofolate synthase [Blochmannia endosymbiont of Polyrhachis (Hedomyrma) turneri]|uniref:bifunctional tetrahydrofolate synthase/dihydrofolate synthase n=1 Tax=Blochmannia endosymbiont of Polyrhachis (Hedomyrma) turneri TaxID=1505596 RepID=UPI00061A7BA0|nr:bifunctional tetrahydrofolate synthase/dihydrofolate synthase [Blochmannia endosymbiont of Polyrhachis (Hedomyrma) turneri]AKC60057.1 Bifunctional protein folC [Blochmannia endosymbiont of Polyrhachis (Hedomyrma) turneri]